MFTGNEAPYGSVVQSTLKTISRRGFLLVTSAVVAATACATEPIFPPPFVSKEAQPVELTPAPENGERATVRKFRVATYNINFSYPRTSASIDAISACRADVVLLQEFDKSQASKVGRELDRQYPFQHLTGAGCLALLSREPLLGVKHFPTSKKGYGAVGATVRLGGELLQIINLNLWPWNPGEDGRSERNRRRIRELAAVTSDFDLSIPTVVAGDFGSLPGWAAITFLEDLGMSSTHRIALAAPTFSRDLGTPDKRLDYILYSKHFEALSEHVVRSPGSDHYPLVADLSWRADTANPPQSVKRETCSAGKR